MTVYPAKKAHRARKAAKQFSSLPSSRSPVKKRNARRHAKNQLRAYGTVARREWMKLQPCCFCEVIGFSVSAHLETGGTSRKADSDRTAPMCDTRRFLARGIARVGCHQLYDAHTIVLLDSQRDEVAAATESAWKRSAQIEQQRRKDPTVFHNVGAE